jgi:hypothetical protein
VSEPSSFCQLPRRGLLRACEQEEANSSRPPRTTLNQNLRHGSICCLGSPVNGDVHCRSCRPTSDSSVATSLSVSEAISAGFLGAYWPRINKRAPAALSQLRGRPEAVMAAGFDGFQGKPISVRELLETVRQILDKSAQ